MALSRQFWTTTTTRSETAQTFTIARLQDVEPTALEVQTHQRGQSLHLGIINPICCWILFLVTIQHLKFYFLSSSPTSGASSPSTLTMQCDGSPSPGLSPNKVTFFSLMVLTIFTVFVLPGPADGCDGRDQGIGSSHACDSTNSDSNTSGSLWSIDRYTDPILVENINAKSANSTPKSHDH